MLKSVLRCYSSGTTVPVYIAKMMNTVKTSPTSNQSVVRPFPDPHADRHFECRFFAWYLIIGTSDPRVLATYIRSFMFTVIVIISIYLITYLIPIQVTQYLLSCCTILFLTNTMIYRDWVENAISSWTDSTDLVLRNWWFFIQECYWFSITIGTCPCTYL